MQLIKITHRRHEGVYIGGARRGLACSPLRNPFRLHADSDLDGIPIKGTRADLLERYRRHLSWSLAHDWTQPREALRALRVDSTLACWCCTRPARVLYGPITDAEDHCHGDVLFTAWRKCQRLKWTWRIGERGPDPIEFAEFPAIHAGLHEYLFASPLWKTT